MHPGPPVHPGRFSTGAASTASSSASAAPRASQVVNRAPPPGRSRLRRTCWTFLEIEIEARVASQRQRVAL